MKFITGLVTGIAIGAIGAVVYSVKSGQDLRESFEQVRAELDKRDIRAVDQLSARLEGRISEMQAQVEERLAQVKSVAESAQGQVSATIDRVRGTDAGDLDFGDALAPEASSIESDAEETLESVVDTLEVDDDVLGTKESADDAVEAAGDVASDAADAAGDVASDAADAAGDALDDARDAASDAVDRAGDTAGEVADDIRGAWHRDINN